MKHAMVRPLRQPIAWGDFEYAALHDGSADDFEHRLREKDLDSEDQRVAVEIIVDRLIHGVS
jgi:hypothetical protein